MLKRLLSFKNRNTLSIGTSHAWIQNVLSFGVQLFFLDEGREDPNAL